MEHVRQVYAFEEQRAGFDRDARLREVEAADAQTLAQKLRAEQQKADIEIEYLERTHEIKMRMFDAETSTQVMQFELQMRALGFQADVIDQRIADFTQRRDELRQQQQDTTDAATQAARENAGIRQAQMVRDQYRKSSTPSRSRRAACSMRSSPSRSRSGRPWATRSRPPS